MLGLFDMKQSARVLSVLLLGVSGCARSQIEEVALTSETPPRLAADPAIEAAILSANPAYNDEMIEAGGGPMARYLFARADLNDDGRDEVFVYLLGSFFCGTAGCDLLVLTQADAGYRVVDRFPISRIPIVVTRERTHGWSDLVREESGGGAPTAFVRHEFDGEKYVEKERLSARSAPLGEAYLADDFDFESGIVLEPRE